MAVEKFSDMTPAIALSGEELLCISQPGNQAVPWVTKRITTLQMAQYIATTTEAGVSMRQLLAAVAADGLLPTLFNALPPDITNSYNIAWYHAENMLITDPFTTGFLQPTLGLNDAQLQALFTLARSFPA